MFSSVNIEKSCRAWQAKSWMVGFSGEKRGKRLPSFYMSRLVLAKEKNVKGKLGTKTGLSRQKLMINHGVCDIQISREGFIVFAKVSVFSAEFAAGIADSAIPHTAWNQKAVPQRNQKDVVALHRCSVHESIIFGGLRSSVE